ncbi:MAG: hypothetical protein ABFD16_14605 [Thermoguttaceae bacterium]|jgi:hypothetical protein
MTIKFYCPLGHLLTAEDHQAGKAMSCVVCGQLAIVPQLAPSTPQPPATRQNAAERSPKEPAAAPPSPALFQEAYRADAGKLHRVRWLAMWLSLVILFDVAPAVLHAMPQPAPTWVWLVLLSTVLQGVFIAWMVATPDWATLRVVTLFFLLVALGYGLVAVWVTGSESPPWGLDSVYRWAPRWCVSAFLITSLGAYLCGHVSSKWHRAFKLEMAMKATRRNRPA